VTTTDDAFEVANNNSPRPGVINEGRHTLRVSSISRGPLPWGGEMRLSLRLACDEAEDAAPIFVDVPFTNDRRLAAVAAALGTDSLTLVEGDLRPFAGQQLEAVVGHYQKRDGSTAAGVKAFLPKTADEPAVSTATEPPPAVNAQPSFSDALVEAVAQRVIELIAAKDAPPRKAKRVAAKRDPRSAAVKVVDALGDDDDIPF
jgi:hypothetical protein